MKIRILFFVCFAAAFGFSQGNIFNHWHFGFNAGIDFNGGTPVPIANSQLNTSEGTASISDENGVLLFYTDGMSVWDRNNSLMPNGTGLTGDISTSQSAMIVQQPGSTTLYYLFTVPPDQGSNLSYSVVDMSLNGGVGDVILASKNAPMPSRAPITCEKITAIRHCNNVDWWIVTHDQSAAGSSNYRVWLLDASGLGSTPVVSSAGTAVTAAADPNGNRGYGWLTANHAGNKMVMASYGLDLIDIVDFDNATGMVSNAIVINGVTRPYGLELSPNDQVLYVSSVDKLLQFDLSQTTAALIEASQQTIYTDFNEGAQVRAVRMGPDGRIYVCRFNMPFLGVVASPDVLGAGCNFDPNGFDVSDGGNLLTFGMLGLPNTYSFGNPCGEPELEASFTPSETVICAGDCITFTENSSAGATAITGWGWQFANGTPNASASQNPGTVCFNTPGTHNVTLTVTDGSLSDDTTIVITVNALPPVTASALPSATVCEGDSVILLGGGAVSYSWDNGAVNGIPFVPAGSFTYTVTGTAANTCRNTASIAIVVTDCDSESIGVPSAFSPDNDGNNDVLFVKGGNIQSLVFSIYNRYGEKVFERCRGNGV